MTSTCDFCTTSEYQKLYMSPTSAIHINICAACLMERAAYIQPSDAPCSWCGDDSSSQSMKIGVRANEDTFLSDMCLECMGEDVNPPQ